ANSQFMAKEVYRRSYDQRVDDDRRRYGAGANDQWDPDRNRLHAFLSRSVVRLRERRVGRCSARSLPLALMRVVIILREFFVIDLGSIPRSSHTLSLAKTAAAGPSGCILLEPSRLDCCSAIVSGAPGRPGCLATTARSRRERAPGANGEVEVEYLKPDRFTLRDAGPLFQLPDTPC